MKPTTRKFNYSDKIHKNEENKFIDTINMRMKEKTIEVMKSWRRDHNPK